MKPVLAFCLLISSLSSPARAAETFGARSAQGGQGLSVRDASAFGEGAFGEDVAEGDAGASAAEEADSIEEKYMVFKASSREIRMLDTGDDIFSASPSARKGRALTSVAGGELQRRFYDEDFRLCKVEYWQIASSSAQSRMRRRLDYSFGADGNVSELRERDFDAQTSAVTFFNADGKVRSSRKNSLPDGKLDSFEIFTYEYDGEGRVLQEDRQVFQMRGQMYRRVLSQRSVNKYSSAVLRETSFYEDSALRLRTVYDDSENYVRTTYFDGGFIVRDFYEGGRKVSSVFSNGKRSGAK